MAHITTDLEYLRNRCSVKVYTGMIVVFPQFCQRELLDVSEQASKFNGCYAVNNSTIAFVFENEVYVTPETNKVRKTLEDAGFRMSCFAVPFSNWDYPFEEKEKWELLKERARQAIVDEFEEECEFFCDFNGIDKLDKEVLRKCFEIPRNGVRIWHLNYEAICYPVVTKLYLDRDVSEKLGTFCCNNGKVVFVYRNGKTYVAKGYKILNVLRNAGFREVSIFVPFSNGETILDEKLKMKWESISKF